MENFEILKIKIYLKNEIKIISLKRTDNIWKIASNFVEQNGLNKDITKSIAIKIYQTLVEINKSFTKKMEKRDESCKNIQWQNLSPASTTDAIEEDDVANLSSLSALSIGSEEEQSQFFNLNKTF